MQSVHIITKVVSSKPIHGELYSIKHYLIKFISDLRQVGGFLRVLWLLHQYNWPPRYNWNIVESGVKHHKPEIKQTRLYGIFHSILLRCSYIWSKYKLICLAYGLDNWLLVVTYIRLCFNYHSLVCVMIELIYDFFSLLACNSFGRSRHNYQEYLESFRIY